MLLKLEQLLEILVLNHLIKIQNINFKDQMVRLIAFFMVIKFMVIYFY